MGKKKSRRGFAAMNPEKRRAVASRGGKAAHAKDAAGQFTSEQAATAGRKGARAAHAKGAAHEFTSEDAREAGKKGGRARWKNRPGGHLAAPAPRPSGRKPGETRGRRADEDRCAEAVRLRAAGLTLAEVGERLGVSRQAVAGMLGRVAGAKE